MADDIYFDISLGIFTLFLLFICFLFGSSSKNEISYRWYCRLLNSFALYFFILIDLFCLLSGIIGDPNLLGKISLSILGVASLIANLINTFYISKKKVNYLNKLESTLYDVKDIKELFDVEDNKTSLGSISNTDNELFQIQVLNQKKVIHYRVNIIGIILKPRGVKYLNQLNFLKKQLNYLYGKTFEQFQKEELLVQKVVVLKNVKFVSDYERFDYENIKKMTSSDKIAKEKTNDKQ